MCALPIAHVEETMRPLPIERLANMPAYVLGLSIVRGFPLPVIDAGQLLSGTPKGLDPQRFVTIKVGARRAVLAVDAVIGIRVLASTSTQDLPPLLHDSAADVVEAITAVDADLLFVLRSARLVPDSVWVALDARLVVS
jgi:purine-binding chemotaxis protein CheW